MRYKTIVFDIDGVILDSNITTIDSYFRTAKKFGANAEQAQALVDYHLQQRGVGSKEKLAWFVETILKDTPTSGLLNELQEAWELATKRGLMNCRLADGIDTLREKMVGVRWIAVSEKSQNQVKILLKERGVADFFDGGIYGGPRSKLEVLQAEKEQLCKPVLLLGDCKYDYDVATQLEFDFVFISDWTDTSDWQAFCNEHHIQTCRSITEFL